MRVVLIGPPGSRAVEHARQFGVPHVYVGDVFRAAIKAETPLGLRIKALVEVGTLVPDALALEVIAERLREPDVANGFVLEGFPRTVALAKALDEIVTIDRCVVLRLHSEDPRVRAFYQRIADVLTHYAHVLVEVSV